MKKKQLLGALLASTLIFTCAVPQTVNAATWRHDRNGWWYQYDNGSYARNEWEYLNGEIYYFDNNGYMATYWKYIDGDWYYFGSDGAKRTGWIQVGSTWYYLDSWGRMQTGWKQFGRTWYYFDSSGAMATNWRSMYGVWYYFGSEGSMRTGWASVGGSWYHFSDSGVMDSGWTYVDGEWYYLGSDGAMYGQGWHYINGAWYYMYSSGVMAHNTWIGDYFVNGSGVMVDTSQGVYLLDVMKPYITPYYTFYHEYTNESFTMAGAQYTNGFELSADGEHSVYFNLGGNYKKISFILGILDGHQPYTSSKLRIVADGKQVASYTLNKGDLPRSYEVSITNCKQLQIIASSGSGYLCLAELKVKR